MTWRLVLAAITLAGIIAVLVYADRRGYAAGVRDRNAYYEPILREAQEALNRANQQTEAATREAAAAVLAAESTHAAEIQTLQARADSAQQRIAALLRHAPAAACGGQSVPAPAGAAPEPAGASASDQRNQRFSSSVSGVGKRCEHDAAELAEFATYYSRLREAINNRGKNP